MMRSMYLLLVQLLFTTIGAKSSGLQQPLSSWMPHSASRFCSYFSEFAANLTSLPGDIRYEAEQALYFSFFQTQLQPACRLTPASEYDLDRIYSSLLATSTPFAICAGGHSWNAGFSNTDDGGVTIDLSRFDKIELDLEKQSVKLGAGLRWKRVYDYLEPHGLTAPGGRDANVGVSGFILGGGLSWNANHVGWTMDALISIRILLPSGEIISASHDAHQDLFWAVKGSGGLLGIIIEYELPVRQQGEFYGGIMSFNSEQVDALIDTVAHLSSHETEYPDSAAYFGGGLVGTSQKVAWSAIMVNMNDTASSKPLRMIEALPNIHRDLRIWNVSSFAQQMDEANPIGLRQTKSTFTIEIHPEVTKRIVKEFENAMHDLVLDSADSWIAVGFQPLTTSHLYRADNMFDLQSSIKKPLFLVSLEARWQDKNADFFYDLKTLHQHLETTAEASLIPFQYANYANAKWQHPLLSYGKSSIQQLRNVINKHDPNGIFAGSKRRLRKGGWNLEAQVEDNI